MDAIFLIFDWAGWKKPQFDANKQKFYCNTEEN